MSVNPKEFWENKILTWEYGRYDLDNRGGILEYFANLSSRSLRARLQLAVEVLTPYLNNKNVIELGCGSGLIAEKLLQAGASSYHGIDFSENAIDRANAEIVNESNAQKIKFEVNDACTFKPETRENNIFLSLGLLDWLNDTELDNLFASNGDAHFLHAIAEKRSSVIQLIHRLYVYIAYGHKTNGYTPRYYTPNQLAKIVRKYTDKPLYVYRNSRLSFGAFISTLPIGEKVVEK